MGLFNLFGGKKKDETKPVKVEAAAVKAEAKPAKADSKPAKAARPLAPEPLAASASGAAQVKLRLKVAQSLRSRRVAAAYEAAKELAAIQAKAGRRVGARMWTAEAERIKAGLPEQTAA
jgi:hypothetical protein